MALVKQQFAQVLNEQPSEKRSFVALNKATEGLEAAERYDKEASCQSHNLTK